MDAVYLLSALVSLLGVIVGLVLTCYMERRSFEARRRHAKLGSESQRSPG